MSNTYFQFKKFRIEQDMCAMKVCTDSCIFGASIPVDKETYKILDIGTGSGLLSLMLAQRSLISDIDAVEMDPSAAVQARFNFSNSQWGNRIHIYTESIQKFASPEKYNLIISNPPFFSNNLESPDKKINMAHHTISLSTDDLLACVLRFLKPDGKFWVMLPPYEADILNKKAESLGLHLNEKLNIRDRNTSGIMRIISLLSLEKKEGPVKEFVIKDEYGKYSDQFTDLLKDYYLNL
jgi:tRNA1Val (adenine37-N6)-methyltransferase